MNTFAKPANVRLMAAVASLLLISALIVRTTQAAFSGETRNDSNTWAAGTVSLENSLSAPVTAMFDEDNMVPGTVSACIDITYTGSVDPASISFAIENATGDLGTYLAANVYMGDADETCATVDTGTYADLTSIGTGAIASGAFGDVSGWDPDPAASTDMARAFHIEVTLADVDAAQGKDLEADFVWSATS